MSHPIYRVSDAKVTGPYTLRVDFDDSTSQVIDFSPVLEGELYGPLRDLSLFNQVQVDYDVNTLIWPNGADFDPATLHDWPTHQEALAALARRWAQEKATTAAPWLRAPGLQCARRTRKRRAR